MSPSSIRAVPTSLLVIVAAGLWGLYWLPVRQLAGTVPGAWGTVLVVMVAALVLAPSAVRRRRELAAGSAAALAATALGGASFVMYSVALVDGRVAVVILLFFLTPVWSTLIGRLVLGWPTSWLRYAAIAVGLAGLGLVLGADGGLPLPRNASEWLGLASGLLWSLATTGIRTRSRLRALPATFVFGLGGLATALVLAATLNAPAPPAAGTITLTAVAWLLAAALVWWIASLVVLLWAARRLEPARLGILQMSEVVVGVVSAALFAGEAMGPREVVGGAMIVAAAVLEVWPVRARAVAR